MSTKSFLKQCFFLVAFIFILTAGNCDKTNVEPTDLSQSDLGATGQIFTGSSECQFYKAETLITDCYRERGFFTASAGDAKNTIRHTCLKEVFQSVWGVYVPYTTLDNDGKNNNVVNWWVQFPDGQTRGNLDPAPHPIEQTYRQQLIAFEATVNVPIFQLCLGNLRGIYLKISDIMIASRLLISSGQTTSEELVRCYKEQLDLYGKAKACITSTSSKTQ